MNVLMNKAFLIVHCRSHVRFTKSNGAHPVNEQKQCDQSHLLRGKGGDEKAEEAK